MAFELKRCGPVGGRSAGNTGRLMKGTTLSVEEIKTKVFMSNIFVEFQDRMYNSFQ